jgi:hypothetical protein
MGIREGSSARWADPHRGICRTATRQPCRENNTADGHATRPSGPAIKRTESSRGRRPGGAGRRPRYASVESLERLRGSWVTFVWRSAFRRAGRGRQGLGSGLGSREVLVGAAPRNDVSRMWAGYKTSFLTTFDAARCTKRPDFAAGRQRLADGSEHRADGSKH